MPFEIPDLTIAPAAGAYRTVQDSEIDPAIVYAQQKQLARLHRKLSTMNPSDPASAALRAEAANIQAQVSQAQRHLDGTVYRIASINREILAKRVKSLSKRGIRAGSGPVIMRLLGHAHLAPLVGSVRLGEPLPSRARMVEYEWIALRGPEPRAEGYEIIARLEPLPDGHAQIIRRMPNISPAAAALDIESFRGRAQYCDHCNTLRRRKNTYLLYSDEAGDLKQVGRTCLADYTGTELSEAVLKHAEAYYQLVSSLSRYKGDYEIPRHAVESGYKVKQFLVACAQLVREDGRYYTKASLALYEQDKATAPRAWQRLRQINDPKVLAQMTPEARECLAAKDVDRSLARKVYEFLCAFDDGSEYAANLRGYCSQPYVTRRGAGTVGSAFALYAKSLQPPAEDHRLNEHFGIIAQRYPLRLQVERCLELQDSFGSAFWMYVLQDEAGRSYRFTRSRFDLDVGGLYDLNATIKDHDDSERFGRVTVLANVRSIKSVNDN